MTPSRSWRRASALIATSAAALVGVGLSAGTASAHTPTWSVTCSEVTLDLTAYNGNVDNTVTVTADGKDLLSLQTFKSNFSKKLDLPTHSSELTIHLSVKAGDGDRFSKEDTKVAPVCEGAPATTPPATPPATQPAPSQSPTTAPTASKPPATPAPSGSQTSAAAVPAGASSSAPGDLAETGSSSSTPLIAGLAAVVVVAGGGLVFATRKRRATQH